MRYVRSPVLLCCQLLLSPSLTISPLCCSAPFPLQRLLVLEKAAAAAVPASAGASGGARPARRPRAPLVLYQPPRRGAAGEGAA